LALSIKYFSAANSPAAPACLSPCRKRAETTTSSYSLVSMFSHSERIRSVGIPGGASGRDTKRCSSVVPPPASPLGTLVNEKHAGWENVRFPPKSTRTVRRPWVCENMMANSWEMVV